MAGPRNKPFRSIETPLTAIAVREKLPEIARLGLLKAWLPIWKLKFKQFLSKKYPNHFETFSLEVVELDQARLVQLGTRVASTSPRFTHIGVF